jgi:Domain of unknown function (DUF5615)
MRILLDEDLPWPVCSLLVGHLVVPVQKMGWSGTRNGKLLALAATHFDVLLTMDGNLEFQQNLATLPIAVLVVDAISNRMVDLAPLAPAILRALEQTSPCTLRHVSA